MDRRQRIPSDNPNAGEVAIRAALDQRQSQIWTTLPAFLKSFDPATLTCEAQPTIQAQLLQPDGKWIDTTIPLCVDCPVMFPGGGNFTLTFPLTEGDEGLLVFAARCIDSWWQSGGVQTQAELRMHDLSDGFFFPTAGLSQPNIPKNIDATATELRTKDGNNFVHLEPGKAILSVGSGAASLEVDGGTGKVLIVAPGGLWVNGIEVVVP